MGNLPEIPQEQLWCIASCVVLTQNPHMECQLSGGRLIYGRPCGEALYGQFPTSIFFFYFQYFFCRFLKKNWRSKKIKKFKKIFWSAKKIKKFEKNFWRAKKNFKGNWRAKREKLKKSLRKNFYIQNQKREKNICKNFCIQKIKK